MNCTGKLVGIAEDFRSHKFTLQLEINEDIQSCLDDLRNAEKLNISLTRHNEKRSLDANAYFWALVGKIAQKTHGKSKEEIYKSYIGETGAFKTLPIREDAISRWKEIWEAKGVGWVAEDLGECKNLKGYHYINCYYGSSVYDTAEMAHLIDMAVQDAQALGIETMTPEELDHLKELWK